MIVCGLALLPKGIIDVKLKRVIALTVVAGVGMVVIAQAAKPLGPLVAAPLSLGVYASGLWLTGALEKHQVSAIVNAVLRRRATL